MAFFKVTASKRNPLSPESLRMLGDELGVLFVSRINEAFEEGGYDDAKWAPSMRPNLGRIFNVINKKRVQGSNQRLQEAISKNQKTLVDTGTLKSSFNSSVVVDKNKMSVIVGTNVDYAPKLHYGGQSVINITPLAVTNIKNLIKNPDFKFLEQFIAKRNMTINIQQRKLISFDRTMKEYTIKAFDKWRNDLKGKKQ